MELVEALSPPSPARCADCGYKYTCSACVLNQIGFNGTSSSSVGSSSSPPPTSLSSWTEVPTDPPLPEIPPLLLSTRQCWICCNDLSLCAFPRNPPSARCTHAPGVCTKCLAQCIEQRLESPYALVCPCPNYNCGLLLNYEEVQALASEEAFHRYDTKLLFKELRNEPGFIWCKNAKCGSGQLHSSGDASNIVTCAQCGSKSCFTHDVPWHEGMTCQEYDKTRGNRGREAAVKRYFERKTKPCPKCNTAIEKNLGCDHMTCAFPGGCGHEFCWACLASYDEILREGNHFHRPTCKFYYSPSSGGSGRRKWLFFGQRR